MDIFDSFVKWLEGLFEPLINLYHEDSTTFFVGAIFVVLLLLIIVILLARRAEDDDRPSKKIKYDDIDWSMDGDDAKQETTVKAETAVKADAKAPAIEAPEKSYGVGEVDVDKNTFGHEGLSPEVQEALMRSVRAKREEDFSVPMWMTKQTLSLDDIEMVDAQAWVEEQLKAKEAKAHDRNVEKATVERIAEILEKIDLCDKAKEDYKRRKAEAEATEPKVEAEMIDLDKIAPLEPVSEPIAEPEESTEDLPVSESVEDTASKADENFETGTLAKILKEVEELRAESDTETPYENFESDNKASLESAESDEPGWGVAATLARLEAMQNENDSLLKEIEADGGYDGDLIKDRAKSTGFAEDLPPLEKPDFPEVERELYESDVSPSVIDKPEMVMPEKRSIRRFGLKNRDTNRSGKKFTEEELMKQIRD